MKCAVCWSPCSQGPGKYRWQKLWLNLGLFFYLSVTLCPPWWNFSLWPSSGSADTGKVYCNSSLAAKTDHRKLEDEIEIALWSLQSECYSLTFSLAVKRVWLWRDSLLTAMQKMCMFSEQKGHNLQETLKYLYRGYIFLDNIAIFTVFGVVFLQSQSMKRIKVLETHF